MLGHHSYYIDGPNFYIPMSYTMEMLSTPPTTSLIVLLLFIHIPFVQQEDYLVQDQ